MWRQWRRWLKALVGIAAAASILQIAFTLNYAVTSSGSDIKRVPEERVFSYDWLKNANLSELRQLVFNQLEPMGLIVQDKEEDQCHTPWRSPDGFFNLTVDKTQYFKRIGGLRCLREGTDFLVPTANLTRCPCKRGWSGASCSVPDSVRYSNYPFKSEGEPRLRSVPRRIIQAMPFNIEFAMLEARFAEVGDIVEVFMILESNYTAFGDPKPLRLLERLKAGYYADVACKIVHVFLNYFPKGAKANGWLADNIHRDYIASHGLPKQIKNYRLDDVFFLSDADELVSRESILFLKLHDGWPEPVGFYLQKNAYGFFWRPAPPPIHVIGGVTIGVLTRVLSSRAISIRSAPARLKEAVNNINVYKKSFPQAQPINKLWSLGNKTYPAGFHCSWCCPAECMRIKLTSAQNGDFPRWGDYVAKTNLTYIRGIIQRGLWFDNKGKFTKGIITAPHYAPRHFLENKERYRDILVNPYENQPLILSDRALKENTNSIPKLQKTTKLVVKPSIKSNNTRSTVGKKTLT